MAIETLPRLPQRLLVDRVLSFSQVHIEIAGYVVLMVLSIIAHLWGLGTMALHHDESIHAYMSWSLLYG